MKQRQCRVHIAVYPNGGTHVVVAKLVGRDLQAHALKAHAVVVVHLALMLLAQNIWQAATEERHIGTSLLGAGHSELPVVCCTVDLL